MSTKYLYTFNSGSKLMLEKNFGRYINSEHTLATDYYFSADGRTLVIVSGFIIWLIKNENLNLLCNKILTEEQL